MKTYDRKCPYCRHMNRKLYLEETGGLMECEKCGEVSYVLIPQAGEVYDMRSRSIKKVREFINGSALSAAGPLEAI